MWRKIIAMTLALAIPAGASAGPLKEAAEKAGRDMALAQRDETRSRSRARFWTGIALIGGGGALATLSRVELGDDETGADDGEDNDASDDGEDSDGLGEQGYARRRDRSGRSGRRAPLHRAQEVRTGGVSAAGPRRSAADRSLLEAAEQRAQDNSQFPTSNSQRSPESTD